eukprot:CAMPEP_0195521372 /NCGR_PEP_ID=MMETSP0794_2-20130614/18558_1 /TAXON_ID=515487 /ORGANISM="Stephanopyxis turris, Strain CCMP 815" /LENGTH=223 /DNA_ID=CAMNT_0040650911 /DNA_START=226 /DNA_END=897 /DNA_ORIENTATION=+
MKVRSPRWDSKDVQLSTKTRLLSTAIENGYSNERIYFDIDIGGTPCGRLTFKLADPTLLPLHTENLKKLCTGERRAIDPAAHYVGCTFDFSPDYVEDGLGRYRWAHILKGRGHNAVGKATDPISDPSHLLACTNSCFGGQYYGVEYQAENDDAGVLLTVPIVGPGRGSSRIAIVRVGESPQEWRERLLVNSAVLGKLESGLETLHAMARQKVAPPKIIAAGLL